jgi:MFS transporter, DHA3 family, macrolide efflux protein
MVTTKNSDQPQPAGSKLRKMRTFLIVWAGQTLSVIGSGLTTFALGVWIFQETGRATPYALTVLFWSLPRILLAPAAGSLADRWNRRYLMILADTGAAFTTLVLVFLFMGGRLEIWHIYFGAFISSSFSTFQDPAYTASISMLVPKKDLVRANGLVQMSSALNALIAPLLAGFLFVLIGLPGIILIDFISFFAAVGTLLLVRIPQPETPATGDPRAGMWQDILFGWRYLRERAGLFWLLFYFAAVNFFMNLAVVLTGPLVLSFGSPKVLGLVNTGLGAGMLAGSLLISSWGGPQRRLAGLIGFIALGSIGLVYAGLQPLAVTIGAGLAMLMFCIPISAGLSQTIFQSKVDPAVQGRVFAIRGAISQSIMPLAFLLAGPLADHLFQPLMSPGGALAVTALGRLLSAGPGRGIGLMFVLSGLLLLTVSVLAYSHPRIRHLEQELPDALLESDNQIFPAAAPAD